MKAKYFKVCYYYLKVIACFFVLESCKSEDVSSNSVLTVERSDLKIKQGEGLYYYEGKRFTGVASVHYKSGEKALMIDFKEGAMHGYYTKWFQNGELSFQCDYSDGKRHGKCISWWKNGNKRSESFYINGLPEGIVWQWYKSGAKFKKMQLVGGKEQGLQQSWRENGKLYNNYEARNGRVYGLKRSKLCFKLDDEIIQ